MLAKKLGQATVQAMDEEKQVHANDKHKDPDIAEYSRYFNTHGCLNDFGAILCDLYLEGRFLGATPAAVLEKVPLRAESIKSTEKKVVCQETVACVADSPHAKHRNQHGIGKEQRYPAAKLRMPNSLAKYTEGEAWVTDCPPPA